MRGFELDELTAYLGSNESKPEWKKYAEDFETLSDDQGNARFRLTLTWSAFLTGPLFLIYRKNYLYAAVVFAITLALGSLHPGIFFALWPLTGFFASYLTLRRFLSVVRESKTLGTDRQGQLDFIRKRGGTSLLVEFAHIIP